MVNKRLLNAGAGSTIAKRIAPLLSGAGWNEVRLDVDSQMSPDIVGSITDVASLFPPSSFDGIWCSHAIEHLYAHEVHPTFLQFRHILKPDGFALILCPDLEEVAKHLLEHGLAGIAYNSPSGPIRPLDMIYGHSRAIEDGRHYMSHKTGFTAERLGTMLQGVGFREVSVLADNFELCALALMPAAPAKRIQDDLLACGFDFQNGTDSS